MIKQKHELHDECFDRGVSTTRAATLINSQNQTNLMRVDQGVCNQRQHKVKTLCSTSFFALNDENKRK